MLLAEALVIVIVFFYNGWPAKMGLVGVPFWQPSTLCFVAVIVQCYCVCIMENKPSFSFVLTQYRLVTDSYLLFSRNEVVFRVRVRLGF